MAKGSLLLSSQLAISAKWREESGQMSDRLVSEQVSGKQTRLGIPRSARLHPSFSALSPCSSSSSHFPP